MPKTKDESTDSVIAIGPVTAKDLKNELWQTLKDVRSGKSNADVAAAVALLGHGILRTVKLELDIVRYSAYTNDIAEFTGTTLVEDEA